MTHEEHAHGADASGAHFSEAEWQALRREDLAGGTAVVTLMAAIFLIGLVLYLIVAWSVT
jgi:hypothetical protein